MTRFPHIREWLDRVIPAPPPIPEQKRTWGDVFKDWTVHGLVTAFVWFAEMCLSLLKRSQK